MGRGRPSKFLSKEQCQAAMAKTKSVRAAARYLNISYGHCIKFFKMYTDKETGKTFLELHKNQAGKGIPKFLKSKGKEPALIDIIEGRIDASNFSPEKIKYRLIEEGHLEECCNSCGFNERRVLDYKMPLLLHFKDNNKKNYRKDNIQLLCYNCYFLFIGDVFTSRDIKHIEDHVSVVKTTEAVNFEVDDYHLKRLKELGLDTQEDDPDNVDQYISRI